MEHTLEQVRSNVLVAQEAYQNGGWHQAAEQGEAAVAFMTDCYVP